MYTRTQRQGTTSAHFSRGATDWHALEVQLNRTRTILQEILVHLQEVLKNLKMARTGATGSGATRTDPGAGRFRAQECGRNAGTAGSRFRAGQAGHQSAGHSARTDRQPPPHQGQGATASGAATGTTGPTGTSDRFRAGRAEAGFRAGTTAGGFRSQTDQHKTQAETGRTTFRPGPSASRTTAGPGASRTTAGPGASRTTAGPGASRTTAGPGAANRERPRAESAWRTRTAGQAGPERETRAGHGTASTAGSRPGPRPASARPQTGFSMDGERQRRAREAARASGMNLKCAYDILCLDYPSSVDEIKVAYRHMARLYHPDLGGDEEAMKDVNVAYEMAMRFCAGPRRASAAWAV